MRNSAIDFIEWALARDAFEFKENGYVLSGGDVSSYIFNADTLFYGDDILRTASFLTEAVNKRGIRLPNVVFASPYTSIPLATEFTALNCDSCNCGQRSRLAFYRKEVKKHGRGGLIVGKIFPGDTVGIVDDVLTGGGSLETAHRIILEAGGIPIWAAVLFDRKKEGSKSKLSVGQEFEEEHRIPLVSVATKDDLVTVLSKHKTHGDSLKLLAS